MAYELFCQFVRGYKHILKDIPCEDYGAKKETDSAKIFVVSDGHGDPQLIRTNRGSKIICDVVSEELSVFEKQIADSGWEYKLFDEEERELLIRQLIRSIMAKWTDRTYRDTEQDSFSEEELANSPKYASNLKKNIDVEVMYGATMIAALMTDQYLLLLQQGDGRCDVFDCNGKVSQPIPWDDRCFANVTTSLCDPDVIESCRYHVIDLKENPIIACVAGSDGVEDSFPESMEKTHAYYRKLLKYACDHGVDELEDYLKDELSSLSKYYPGADDVTVCGIVDVDRVRPFLDYFAEQNVLVDISDEIEKYDAKISSIEVGGRYTHLKKEYETAKELYNSAQERYDTLMKQRDDLVAEVNEKRSIINFDNHFEGTLERLLSAIGSVNSSLTKWMMSLEKIKKELEEAEDSLNVARERLHTVEAEFLPYNEEYEKVKQSRKEAQIRLDEFKAVHNNK